MYQAAQDYVRKRFSLVYVLGRGWELAYCIQVFAACIAALGGDLEGGQDDERKLSLWYSWNKQ